MENWEDVENSLQGIAKPVSPQPLATGEVDREVEKAPFRTSGFRKAEEASDEFQKKDNLPTGRREDFYNLQHVEIPDVDPIPDMMNESFYVDDNSGEMGDGYGDRLWRFKTTLRVNECSSLVDSCATTIFDSETQQKDDEQDIYLTSSPTKTARLSSGRFRSGVGKNTRHPGIQRREHGYWATKAATYILGSVDCEQMAKDKSHS